MSIYKTYHKTRIKDEVVVVQQPVWEGEPGLSVIEGYTYEIKNRLDGVMFVQSYLSVQVTGVAYVMEWVKTRYLSAKDVPQTWLFHIVNVLQSVLVYKIEDRFVLVI